jgi:hypothetical protein
MRADYRPCFVAAVLLATIAPLMILPAYAQEEQGGFVFTPDLLRLTELAVQLTNVAYTEAVPLFETSTMTIYRDEPDQAIVTKIDGHCFGAFRGTVFHRWDDWVQNIMVGDMPVCSPVGDCCDVQQGHYQAYFYASYQKDFENALRDCAATCIDGRCPVVLVGHSQGYVVNETVLQHFIVLVDFVRSSLHTLLLH